MIQHGLIVVALAFCLTETSASGYGSHQSHNGHESDVNRVNARRQLAVNRVAQHVGSGTGTARRDGVPGTPLGRTGYAPSKGYSTSYSKGDGNGYGSSYGNSHSQVGYNNHASSGYGSQRSHNGYEADVNRENAIRQMKVNSIAQHVGSGTGTARRDGVPGTPLGRTGRGTYSARNRYPGSYSSHGSHGSYSSYGHY